MSIKENIAEEFNEFSKNYTNDMVAIVPYYEKLMDAFTESLPINFQPEKILDIGCGNGNVSRRLMKLFPKAKYTFLDASSQMLNLCRQQFSDYHVDYVESYFKDFSFKENEYDLIVAGLSIHHCRADEKEYLLKRIYSSLKAQGIFSCSDLMIERPSLAHDELIEKWKSFVFKTFPDGQKWNWVMDHYNEFDFPHSIALHKKWLVNAGFDSYKFESNEECWSFFSATK